MVSKAYNGFSAQYRDKQGGQVYKAFKKGELKRPDTCTMCKLTEAQATIHAHNEDYHEPLTFVGLCYFCHMAVHKRFESTPRWYRWRDLICTGWQPPRNRDYRVFADVWQSILKQPQPELKKEDYINWSWTLPDHEPDLFTGREPLDNGLFQISNDTVTKSENNPT